MRPPRRLVIVIVIVITIIISIIIINNNNLKTINNYDSIRNKHIGFVFQFHNLIAELNIIENVTIPTLIAGKNNDTDYINKLFEYFNL